MLRLLREQRGRVRVRVGITVDLESTAAEEWNCDAAHAVAPLRTAAAACISWLAPQRRPAGEDEPQGGWLSVVNRYLQKTPDE